MNNFVFLKGRIGQNAERKYTRSNKPFATFSMAVYDGKDADGNTRSMWVNVEAFDYDRAELLTQGANVSVAGKLSIDNYKDNNGNSRTYTKVVTFGFDGVTVEPKMQRNNGNNQNNRTNYQNNRGGMTGGPETFSDDNIPF